VASAWSCLDGSKLLGETRVLWLRTDGVYQLFAADVVRFSMTPLSSTPIRIRLSSIPGAIVVRHW
jgi:hypothetical protein